MAETPRTGTLHIVSTPIGNLADITLRALDTLRSVHRIAAEDTRHTRKLLSHYDIHKPLSSYHAHNARERGGEILAGLMSGEDIAVVTDAGTPCISDPGELIVRAAIEAGIPVVAIPGPSTPITALILSGLATHPFAFLGFPPSRGTPRKRFFSDYAALSMTLILFESPQRLQKTLDDIITFWGNRHIAVARELTKRYEEVFRGTTSEAQAHYAEGVRGECTLVVEGANAAGLDQTSAEGSSGGDWREELQALIRQGNLSVKDAAEKVASGCGQSRRTVYQEALRIKKGSTESS